MSETTTTSGAPASRPPSEETLGGLVHQLSTQVPELIRSELRLAQAEVTQKGRDAGKGLGAFGAAGLLALYGVGCLLAAAILALALALPAWAAALVVGGVLLAVAGIAALLGRNAVAKATPPAPERAIAGLKQDVETLKGGNR
ncbi:phage holin family protein [Nocardioides nanhaiensis]|uniref:Phage holin family protein n=1 Tax=Nocardioides nanhaiensis TaxID=1476871 RepID=A0ABP8W0M6_9ACTN